MYVQILAQTTPLHLLQLEIEVKKLGNVPCLQKSKALNLADKQQILSKPLYLKAMIIVFQSLRQLKIDFNQPKSEAISKALKD